jgi:hypothetical protein
MSQRPIYQGGSRELVQGRKCSFLKKRTKKLLLLPSHNQIRKGPRMPASKSFLLLFFKKEDLPALPFTC